MNKSLHRVARIDSYAAISAGLIAGIVFLVLEMLMVWAFLDTSPWAPPRMIAAIAMGERVLPPPASFDLAIVFFATVIHLVLSVLIAFVVGFIIKGKGVVPGILIGAASGLVVYLVHFYGMTEVFPWFANARNWVSVFCHLVFGVVLGGVYALRAYHPVSEPGAGAR